MEINRFFSSFCCLVFLVLIVSDSESVSVWKDITLSSKEKHALDKFKELMNKTVTQDYMRKDIYLIKWLRARDLNIREAELMLKQHLKWRKEYGMDYILEEDWRKYERDYPYTTDGVDYEGRPVMALSVADWDIRRAILSGQRDMLTRYAFSAYEKGSRIVREKQAKGENVTQFIMVCNFESFNLVQHACPPCVQFLVEFLIGYEANFPAMADSIIGIKTPAAFELVLNALRPVMSKETRAAYKIWGVDRRVWQTNLLKQVPPEELDEEFGGTRNVFR